MPRPLRLALLTCLTALLSPTRGALQLVADFETGSGWYDPTNGQSARTTATTKLNELAALLSPAYSGTYTIRFTDNEFDPGVLASVPRNTVTTTWNGHTVAGSRLWAALVTGTPVSGIAGTIDWNFGATGYFTPQLESTLRHELMHILGMFSNLPGAARPTLHAGVVDYRVNSGVFIASAADLLLRDRSGRSPITFNAAGDAYIGAAYDLSTSAADWSADNPGLFAEVLTASGATSRLAIASDYDAATDTGTLDPSHIWKISYRIGLSSSPDSPRRFNTDDADLLRALGYQVIPEPAAGIPLALLALLPLRLASRRRASARPARSI